MKMMIFGAAVLSLAFSCTPAPLGEAQIKTYLEAKARYEEGNFPAAAGTLGALLKDRGDFFQARFLLAKAYFFSNHLPQAEEELTRLVKDHPEHSQGEFWLALVEAQTQRLEAAERRIDTLLSRDPQDYRLLYERGLLYLKRNNWKDALDFFNQATLAEVDLAKPHLEAGRIFYGLGDLPKAEDQLTRARTFLGGRTALDTSVQTLLTQIHQEANPGSPKSAVH